MQIEENMFNSLVEKIQSTIQKKDMVMREALSAKPKLQITLRYLATGDSLAFCHLFRILLFRI
nr:unnamed protein product [Callosobruchus analis]